MRISRLFLVLSALAVVAATMPAFAEGESLPAACAGNSPALAEGETLVEHTLYFHGASAVGNPDQAEAFGAASVSDKKTMDALAPTGTDSKIDLLAAGSNSNFNGNPAMSYFKHVMEQEATIVCAGTTFFGASQGVLTAKLFVDKAWADTAPAASKAATATGADTIKSFTVNFGVLNVEAWDNLVLQIAPASAGAVHYDSTAHPSSFTYVTIAPAPAPEPTPTPAP